MRSIKSLATVATLLESGERSRFDAAVGGRFAALHARTVDEVLQAVRERPVHAVLVSPRCVGREQLSEVARLISGFPGVPTVAVLSGHDPSTSERLLDLGAHGVRTLFDLSARDGWRRLRDLVSHPASPTATRILERVLPVLGDTPPGCRQFFEILVRLGPSTTTVRSLARRVRVRPSTFMSRFFRSGLPSPKRYLAGMRLVYAAGLLESPGLSVADVAYRLDYSSPQSFGRHLRAALGVTATEFRRRYPLAAALDDFVSRMIVPFRIRLRTFHPMDHGVDDPGQE